MTARINKSAFSKYKEQLKLIAYISLILLFFVFFFSVVIKKPFLLGNDQWFQYNEFYKEWIRLIKDAIHGNGLPFYSWNMFLGTDFYSSMGYYCTGDIFLPMLLTVFRNNIEFGLLIETIICVYISALSFDLFLRIYGVEDESSRIFVSIVYTIGGQVILYIGDYMFHRFYSFLPLLFFGVLYYFKENKRWPFILAVAVLFLQNYYFMFPTTVFLVLFCLWQEWVRDVDLNSLFKDFVSLFSSFVAGFFISAIIVLPSVYSLLGNPRLQLSEPGRIRWDRNVYYGLYLTLVSTNPSNIPGSIFYTSHDAHDSWYNLYIGVLPLLASLDHLTKRKNYKDAVFFGVLTTIMLIRPLNSIMHGFSVPSLRWLFLYEFMLLMFASNGLEERNMKKEWIILALYVLGCAFIRVQGDILNWIDASINRNHLLLIYLSLGTGSLIFLISGKKRKLAYFMMVLQIMASASYYYSQSTKGIELHYEEAINPEFVDYFHDQDNDRIFRYYLSYSLNNPVNELNRNKSLSYHMMSTATYSSTYDTNITRFIDLADCGNALDWDMEVEDPFINTALGVKYYIVYKQDDLPKELPFHYVYNLNHLEVYENESFKGFGYTNSSLDHLSDDTDPQTFIATTYVDEPGYDLSPYTALTQHRLNVTSYNSDSLAADINVDSANILVIPIPNNKGWNVTLNGRSIQTISVNGGFMGIPVDKGYNEIQMHFTPPLFLAGAALSAFGLLYFVYRFFKDTIARRSA